MIYFEANERNKMTDVLLRSAGNRVELRPVWLPKCSEELRRKAQLFCRMTRKRNSSRTPDRPKKTTHGGEQRKVGLQFTDCKPLKIRWAATGARVPGLPVIWEKAGTFWRPGGKKKPPPRTGEGFQCRPWTSLEGRSAMRPGQATQRDYSTNVRFCQAPLLKGCGGQGCRAPGGLGLDGCSIMKRRRTKRMHRSRGRRRRSRWGPQPPLRRKATRSPFPQRGKGAGRERGERRSNRSRNKQPTVPKVKPPPFGGARANKKACRG